MTLDDVEKLATLMRTRTLTECEWQDGDTRLLLRRAGPAGVAGKGAEETGCGASQEGTAASEANAARPNESSGAGTAWVKAPRMGLFRATHPLSGKAQSDPGQTVTQGQVLGYIQAHEAWVAVRSPMAGVVRDVLADDGMLAGYAQPLYLLDPSGHEAGNITA